MSYDLAVYAARASSVEELRDLVAQGSGLQVDEATVRTLTIVRGVRRRYSFTVDGPDAVDFEDIPAEVAAAVLGVRWLYSISVEGTTESEVLHAVRFARRLAQALNGAVVDQQTDEVWSRSQSRKVQKPQRESRVSTVDVAWYCLREDLATDAAVLFVDAARRFLPEALPRRFGEYEPFQGKLVEAGLDGFTKAWADATSMLFTAGSGPCIGGHLSAGPSAQFPDRFWSISLTFHAEPIREVGWQEALRALFVTLADELPAFYASAEVTEGHIWTGRSLWSDSETEWGISPVRYRDGWTGLPPKPTWWTWLGRPFMEYHSAFPPDRVTATARGVMYEASKVPGASADLVSSSAWLPAELFSSLAPNPHRQQPVPLVPARVIPADLRPA
ncbi:hypothetical protein [Agromyces ramosus]|uniref:Uncharacterized protein n=1 Tax=Agromyces ramosus TaxID=33879 RepID=A0ABU0RDA2_9MICO|nr:hypothetical protein [Agromyces ramosus]MDQ0896055.1 hypothetical protein [Agromyces ramosus]